MPAKEETSAPDAVIDIPDPELKKAILDALGIENREITVTDTFSLVSLVCDYEGGDAINDISGLSAFPNLKELTIYYSEISDISPLGDLISLTHLELLNSPFTDITPLANLPNLCVLFLSDNPVVENLTREEILDSLSGAERLQYLDYGAEEFEPVSYY